MKLLVKNQLTLISNPTDHGTSNRHFHNQNFSVFALSLIFSLLFSLHSYAQEMTLYVIPPKKPMNWESPRKLLFSYGHSYVAKTKYKDFQHPLGHIIVELKDSCHHTVLGMVSKSPRPLSTMVWRDGYGLGVLFAVSPGELREGSRNTDDIQSRYADGDISYIRFKISQEAFNRLWQYQQEYQEFGYDSIYNGLNKPREGSGAGCSAFGVSYIDIAGLMPGEIIRDWQVSVQIPNKLIGGPMGEHKRVGLAKILWNNKWAKPESNDAVPISYYEPIKMFRWINATWDDENKTLPATYGKELRGLTKGIVIDCTAYSIPNEPIWKNKIAKTTAIVAD